MFVDCFFFLHLSFQLEFELNPLKKLLNRVFFCTSHVTKNNDVLWGASDYDEEKVFFFMKTFKRK